MFLPRTSHHNDMICNVTANCQMWENQFYTIKHLWYVDLNWIHAFIWTDSGRKCVDLQMKSTLWSGVKFVVLVVSCWVNIQHFLSAFAPAARKGLGLASKMIDQWLSAASRASFRSGRSCSSNEVPSVSLLMIQSNSIPLSSPHSDSESSTPETDK